MLQAPPFSFSKQLILSTDTIFGFKIPFLDKYPTLDKLTEILGNRLASRIWNSSIKIELRGKDRRGDIID